MADAAREFRGAARGEVIADRFGRFKFRERDAVTGAVKPNPYLDDPLRDDESH